jgi:hypothetical protein
MVNYCFVLPYLPAGAEPAKKFVQENRHGKDMTIFTELQVSLMNRFGFNAVHQVVAGFLILKQ